MATLITETGMEVKVRIAFDQQVFLGREALTGLGELLPLPEGGITPQAIRDADVLIVRSTTHVDDPLLANSPIRFVGSVTAGMDHVNLSEETARRLTVAHAPGCNADSVSCYVAAALLGLWRSGRLELPRCRVGIVGKGQVGGRVARWVEALGLEVVACDPPRQRAGEANLHALEEALACDVVTLHVPLTFHGRDATANLLDGSRLMQLKRGAWLIHTCRGGVVDEEALKQALRNQQLAGAVVDVWRDEPDHDPDLLRLVALGTPHIAGHSVDGKARGTWMVREALVEWLQRQGLHAPPRAMEAYLPAGPELNVPKGLERWEAAAWAVLQLYDPWIEDAAFRVATSRDERRALFATLRRQYPPRRDSTASRVVIPPIEEVTRVQLKALGFDVHC